MALSLGSNCAQSGALATNFFENNSTCIRPRHRMVCLSARKISDGGQVKKPTNITIPTPSPRLSWSISSIPGGASIAFLEKDAEEPVPKPIVLIDQDSDANATIVDLSFGDRLGALEDTMKALTDLGLKVVKATVKSGGEVKKERFYITSAGKGRKIKDPELLESIRLTIIDNLLQYHPESSQQLAMGQVFGQQTLDKRPEVDIPTRITIANESPERSLLILQTADHPGLTMEVIRTMQDINITVESAELDTEGLVAIDKFHVSYGGAALSPSMTTVLTNCLRYLLKRKGAEEESY